jgi:ribonucleoside-diphosphate reductase alpha chain
MKDLARWWKQLRLWLRMRPSDLPPLRRQLPAEADGQTMKFNIGGWEGYILVALFEDGRVGRIEIRMTKEGSTVQGLLDAWSRSVTVGLQHGVPLGEFIWDLEGLEFDPRGTTLHEHVTVAASIADYLAKLLRRKFCPELPAWRPGEEPLVEQPVGE